MNDLVPIFVIGILTLGVYGLFELFARRQERLSIIEKLSVGIDPAQLKGQLGLLSSQNNKSWAIRIGCLLIGIGLGVFIVSIVELCAFPNIEWNTPIRQTLSTMYVASASMFGGIGLVIAYVIDRKDKTKK